MGLEVTLKELLAERGRSLYWLSQQTGLDYAVLLKVQKGGFQLLHKNTIEGVCKTLRCQPGDFLVFKTR